MHSSALGSEPVISAQALSKRYDVYRQPPGLLGALRGLVSRELTAVHAVTDLDLTVEHGEIIGLLGPNGAGKTTIVKMMSGLLVPTDGRLRVCGCRPATRSYPFLSQISVIFGQKAMLWWDVSTRESLKIHRSMYEIPSRRFATAVAELGELLGITEILDTPVRHLSLGQRMRCELALALLHRPTLLFADEPTIGLDVQAKVVVRHLFREINQAFGTTIVLTSHDMSDVEALAERVVIVTGGRATFDGELAELRTRAALPKHAALTYRDGRVERVRLGDEGFGDVVRAAARSDGLVDVRVVEPGLDEVMAHVFGEGVVKP